MKIFFPKDRVEAEADKGDTLLDVIRRAGIPIEAVCSGQGTCGKCKVSVDGAERLACKTPAEDGMRVEMLTSDEGHVILTDSCANAGSPAINDDLVEPEGSKPKYFGDLSNRLPDKSEKISVRTQKVHPETQKKVAFAVDVGTTTVVVKAVDVVSGEEIAVRPFVNPQIAYGADVMARINNAIDDATLLSTMITGAVDRAIEDIIRSEAAGAIAEKVVVAGNTTMSYLLLNRRCRSLGFVPFKPEYAIDPVYEYPEVFGTKTLSCPVLIYPYISAFVGGDIISGLVNIERRIDSGVSYMLIDMGTNGEIAYRSGERLLTTSTAAGPALEGGNIMCGMSGLPGAIYSVSYEGNGKFSCTTIGGKPAKGICGSGVISLVATLLNARFISESGSFTEEAERFIETTDNTPALKHLVITEPTETAEGNRIIFTQKDVREFQLAKGAIRAGVDILIEEIGEIPQILYLAGGFGQNIEPDSAFRTGLIPHSLEGRIRFAGNTSLGGCVDACLSGKAREPLPSLGIITKSQEINLGADKRFNDKFMETMMFE